MVAPIPLSTQHHPFLSPPHTHVIATINAATACLPLRVCLRAVTCPPQPRLTLHPRPAPTRPRPNPTRTRRLISDALMRCILDDELHGRQVAQAVVAMAAFKQRDGLVLEAAASHVRAMVHRGEVRAAGRAWEGLGGAFHVPPGVGKAGKAG